MASTKKALPNNFKKSSREKIPGAFLLFKFNTGSKGLILCCFVICFTTWCRFFVIVFAAGTRAGIIVSLFVLFISFFFFCFVIGFLTAALCTVTENLAPVIFVVIIGTTNPKFIRALGWFSSGPKRSSGLGRYSLFLAERRGHFPLGCFQSRTNCPR